MSTALVIAEIKAFLGRKGAGVLCIRGKWGVGKTFTWNESLESARKTVEAPISNYSYVSLFGLGSLAALKFAIFENVVSLQGDRPLTADIDSLQSFVESAPSQWRKLVGFAKKLPIVSQFTGDEATGTISFLTIRNMVVCIDDLERKGAGLSVSDVLGLASELRERKGCKVVFLLNEEELDDKASFESYLEKVVDVSLLFDPTAAESAAIAKRGADGILDRTAELCQSLGVRNIRVIKKIDKHVRDAHKLLKDMKPGVFANASASIALLGWSHYQPKEAPSLEYIIRYNSIASRKEPTPQEATWNAQLAAYGYTVTDEFDLELLKGVQRGFFDDAEIMTHAAALQAKLVAKEADGSFEQAWDLYHDSFDDNEEEAVTGIYESFLKNIPYISPLNLNGTVTLLKELGHDDKAQYIIRKYVATRSEDRAFFDLDEYAFAGDISDADVRAAFAKRFADIEETRDFKSMMLGLKDGWNDKTIAALSALDVNAYRALFKEARDAELRRMIAGCLQFGSIVNASEAMKRITATAKEALAAIGTESNINARRVRKYGVVPVAKRARARKARTAKAAPAPDPAGD